MTTHQLAIHFSLELVKSKTSNNKSTSSNVLSNTLLTAKTLLIAKEKVKALQNTL